VLQGMERPLDEALQEADRIYLGELMQLRDAHEGVAAFLEKRAPVWSDL
jgi:enoyl-CoA hydratase/carnithine racemase